MSAIVWIVYVVLPASAGALIHGAPLGLADTWALVAILWLVARRRPIPGARFAAGAVIATLALGALVPAERGFRARYFADAESRGPVERSTEFKGRLFTRIDERLDFGPRVRDFPLWFFNDITRFNFPAGSEPDRQRLAFAVAWDGQLWVDHAAMHMLYLDAPGASAELVVDDARVAAVAPGNGAQTVGVALGGGWHRLVIRFSSPYSSPRIFSVGELVDGRRVPFDVSKVLTRPLESWQSIVADILRVGRTIFDALALAWLAFLVARDLAHVRRGRRADGSIMTLRQQTLVWFAVVVVVDAFVFASPWTTKLWILTGGDDPLTYESYARTIQLNGLLLRSINGPYYYQMFYPYFLAATHRLFGEGMFGPMFVQRLLSATVGWSVVEIATVIAGAEVWPVALGVGAWFAYVMLPPTASAPSTESLFIPLLVAWTAAVVRVARNPTRRGALGAGLLGGITAITRSTAVLTWAAVFPLCWIAWRGVSLRRHFLALMAGCSLLVVSSIAVRNGIVVRQFVPLPTEFGITLLGGNEPPAGLALDYTRRGPLYDRLGVNPLTRTVIEYAITAPAAFARNMGRKALFALGIFEPYAPGWGYSVPLIAIWLAGIIGLFCAFRAGTAPPSIVVLPAMIALVQCAAVVVVYPKGERLILPFYAVLLPYAAVGFFNVGRMFVWRPFQGRHIDPRFARLAGVAVVLAVSAYTLAIRTRGISDHFLMLSEQIRDWSLALGPFSALPRVGTPSTAGGNSFGPIYYWVLWIIRVAIGPMFDNLPHAGGIGLAATQSIADGVLCAGIRKASGSWLFAIAAVLIVASSPFDLALSSVIWNPVLAVTFAKIATGLVLYWQDSLTTPKRVVLAIVAWFAVQAHSGAIPFAATIFLWILGTELRRAPRRALIAAVEIAAVVVLLQLPSMLAPASVQPTKMLMLIRHPQPLRIGDAFRAICAGIESIGLAPLPFPQTSLVLLAAIVGILLTLGAQSAVTVVTVAPIALAVAVWSLWQEEYDAYRFLTIVPAGLLAMMWAVRSVPSRAGRSALTVVLLAVAIVVQKPRIENSAKVFRMPEYGVLVRGSRAVVLRGEPVRRIEVPFLHPLSDPEYLYTLMGGRIRPDAPETARISETGDVTYVR